MADTTRIAVSVTRDQARDLQRVLSQMAQGMIMLDPDNPRIGIVCDLIVALEHAAADGQAATVEKPISDDVATARIAVLETVMARHLRIAPLDSATLDAIIRHGSRRRPH